MLVVFRKLNEPLSEVNMSEAPMCRIYDRDLLARLMKRTGTGARLTTRDLASVAALPHGTVGALLNGDQRFISRDKAQRIAAAIGVDLMVIFVPCERAGRVFVDATAPTAVTV
ncbi:helix-turn-helix transcriptional regulator [Streptomyces brevispora]|uniref:Helix-turn-helix domain-containing protein n=1 Tax=Streptomyces brevispora TaxID=887462 RepID=A0ABZ1G3E2_9ACTN|nr:helix-turn-helix transcriptional regulator [Streptomyces brevispora]WSC14325.1 helix-turn-helix domain-containing protein [Streptomyces brevispora]